MGILGQTPFTVVSEYRSFGRTNGVERVLHVIYPPQRPRTDVVHTLALPPLHAPDAPRVGAPLLLGALRGALRRLALR